MFPQVQQYAAYDVLVSQVVTEVVLFFDKTTGTALPFTQLMEKHSLPAHHFLYAQQLTS